MLSRRRLVGNSAFVMDDGRRRHTRTIIDRNGWRSLEHQRQFGYIDPWEVSRLEPAHVPAKYTQAKRNAMNGDIEAIYRPENNQEQCGTTISPFYVALLPIIGIGIILNYGIGRTSWKFYEIVLVVLRNTFSIRSYIFAYREIMDLPIQSWETKRGHGL